MWPMIKDDRSTQGLNALFIIVAFKILEKVSILVIIFNVYVITLSFLIDETLRSSEPLDLKRVYFVSEAAWPSAILCQSWQANLSIL